MRPITPLLASLVALSLVAVAPAPADALREFRSAWGCNLEVGTPSVSPGATRTVHAVAGATCRKRTRFERVAVRIMRARPGRQDEVVAVDRTAAYFHVRDPVDLQLPEAWGASVHARTRCRQRWTRSDPRLYARAVFKKAGQSERVVIRTPVWSGQGSESCRGA